MECEENGNGVDSLAGRCRVERKRRAPGSCEVQLVFTPELLGTTHRRALQLPMQPPQIPTPPVPPEQTSFFPSPFINVSLMEEITFWVCTRRAPCLYRYNNVFKKRNEEAHCSKYRHSSEPSSVNEVPSPKKKKRKLKILDDESASIESQHNVYFETSHKQYRKSWYSSSKSVTDRSDVDFNIRNSSVRNKSKTSKLRRKNCSMLKKNKVITSTPKPTTLRRSLRKSQQNLNYSGQLNCSFDLLNSSALNGDLKPLSRKSVAEHRNHAAGARRSSVLKERSKNEIVANGQFDDISDVSGFTANYIRSTKINSKTPRKVRSKPSRNLVRESQDQLQNDESKIIVCVNQSANTGNSAAVLNHSTDSSQNVINLVTVNNNNNERSQKINRSTSHIKIAGYKNNQNKESEKDVTQLNISLQSKSNGRSRYPIRHRNNNKLVAQDLENTRNSSIKKKISRGSRELKGIHQIEQNDLSSVSRTRSGKKIGVMQISVEESGCSHGQMNNLTDQVSSSVKKSVGKKKRVMPSKKILDREPNSKDSGSDSTKNMGLASSSSPVKCRRAVDKTRQSLKKDLRDKSGFTACFSDSEEDRPLIRRKFFC